MQWSLGCTTWWPTVFILQLLLLSILKVSLRICFTNHLLCHDFNITISIIDIRPGMVLRFVATKKDRKVTGFDIVYWLVISFIPYSHPLNQGCRPCWLLQWLHHSSDINSENILTASLSPTYFFHQVCFLFFRFLSF